VRQGRGPSTELRKRTPPTRFALRPLWRRPDGSSRPTRVDGEISQTHLSCPDSRRDRRGSHNIPRAAVPACRLWLSAGRGHAGCAEGRRTRDQHAHTPPPSGELRVGCRAVEPNDNVSASMINLLSSDPVARLVWLFSRPLGPAPFGEPVATERRPAAVRAHE
jgi:hypothetical protein